jgi:hypothetical protein
MFTHKSYRGTGFQPVSFPNFSLNDFAAGGQARCLFHFQGKQKKPRLMDEKGLKNSRALLIFPRHPPGLDLAPGVELAFNRLPWLHRASPSATLHETVVSTDADKLA